MTASTGAVSTARRISSPAWLSSAVSAVRVRAVSLVYLLPVLAIGAVANLVGMTGSPQRIDDEGTYTAQAWAVLQYGELAHYTYWYDHPPLGWLQLAGYAGLTGAFARWDVAVLAGREASIVATLIAGVLLWILARRLRVSRPASAIAVLIFLLSPLAVQFHRTVYLDNIATPWLLLAFVLALSRSKQLAAFVGAALAFGIAVLTKETYLLALPVLAWVMVRRSHRETRRYTLSLAATVLVLVGGSYLLLAAVKGELMPGPGRVSLADGILFQLAARDGSGSPLDPESLTSATLGMWWQLDPVFIVAGLSAAVVALAVRRLRPFAVLLVGLAVFMLRPGGYLPVPYVIMLIPFAALLIAGVGDVAFRALKGRGAVRRSGGIVVLTALVAGTVLAVPQWTTQLRGFLLADLDAPLRDAQAWLETNAVPQDRLIVDDAMWVDLVRAGWEREDVVWYYKVDTDPAVQAQSPNGWRDADYVITTDSMRTFPTGFPRVQQALDNSIVVAAFGTGTQAVEIRRVMSQGIANAQDSAVRAGEERLLLGAQLATNPALAVSADDAGLLSSGQVDSRIAVLLGALTGAGAIVVDSFPTIDGEDPEHRRQVVLQSIGGEAAVTDGIVSPSAAAFVDGLQGVYEPQSVSTAGDRLTLRFPVSLEPATSLEASAQ